jgi:hypothetical protein
VALPPAKPKVFHNGQIAVHYCTSLEWMIATREGWWPVDMVDQHTLRFLQKFHGDARLPHQFHRFVAGLLERDPDERRQQFTHMPLLDGARVEL